MRFDLDHDWQGNMSTPRAKVGERAKTRLLIVLCAIWLCVGLIGHSPWKPFESQSISVIKTIIETGNWLTPTAVSHSSLENPPLYYVVASVFATLLSPLLPMHDAARLSTGVWMLITLLMVGMTGREMWGRGFGRQTAFVFMGSLGLIISAHTLMPAVSNLAGLATAFYALALAKRRPYRAAALLGAGLGVSFLSTGLLPAFIIFLTTLLLPTLFSHWRSKQYLTVVLLAFLFASPFLFVWPLLSMINSPSMMEQWWEYSLSSFQHQFHVYFLKTLTWYAWPALPLALWGLWRHKSQLLLKPRFQLMMVFFLVAFVMTGVGGERKEVFALPLLLPLTAMAGGSIETLKRGAAGALNWFGLILFGLLSFLVWLGWTAMMTGAPSKAKERLVFLSGLDNLNFNFFTFTVATAITLTWLFAIFRAQHSNRSSATNWAIGMTCIWTLLMSLWLPMIESARSYEAVFVSFKKSLPNTFACINSSHLSEAERDLLHYYANIKTYRLETESSLSCDLYLTQDERGKPLIEPGSEWQLIWNGKRLSDRKESFRLFQRIN